MIPGKTKCQVFFTELFRNLTSLQPKLRLDRMLGAIMFSLKTLCCRRHNSLLWNTDQMHFNAVLTVPDVISNLSKLGSKQKRQLDWQQIHGTSATTWWFIFSYCCINAVHAEGCWMMPVESLQGHVLSQHWTDNSISQGGGGSSSSSNMCSEVGVIRFGHGQCARCAEPQWVTAQGALWKRTLFWFLHRCASLWIVAPESQGEGWKEQTPLCVCLTADGAKNNIDIASIICSFFFFVHTSPAKGLSVLVILLQQCHRFFLQNVGPVLSWSWYRRLAWSLTSAATFSTNDHSPIRTRSKSQTCTFCETKEKYIDQDDRCLGTKDVNGNISISNQLSAVDRVLTQLFFHFFVSSCFVHLILVLRNIRINKNVLCYIILCYIKLYYTIPILTLSEALTE